MFAVVMITIDRTPQPNFVVQTLAALERAGVFKSPLLDSFTIFDSGSPTLLFLPTPEWLVDSAVRGPVENTATALQHGARTGSPWVLFLEDDIDVCDKFLESVAAWLEEHEQQYPIFPLGANYDQIAVMERLGKTAWKYAIDQFYGTLAVAMRAEIALRVGSYLLTRHHGKSPRDGSPYDLYMADWARENGIPYFLTPVPSFVQHTGVNSTIRPGSIFHTYDTWPGPTWSYQGRA